jgi:hypothetical protein
VGLYYDAQWRSGKLVQCANELGIGLNQHKYISEIGMILANTHYQGLKFGQDFDNLNNMPEVEEGTVVPANTIWTDYDKKVNYVWQ